MPIIATDIKDARPAAPSQVRVTLNGGKVIILDVQEWIDLDPLNRTLQKPAEFSKGYPSASGGVEWAHGPYLSFFKIAELLNIQAVKSAGAKNV